MLLLALSPSTAPPDKRLDDRRLSANSTQQPATVRPLDVTLACPRVYVYNLPAPFQDLDQSTLHSKEAAFGPAFEGDYLRATSEYSLTHILASRLAASGCTTANPAEAELFFIPVLAKPKGHSEFTAACGTFNQEYLRGVLPYLTSDNAHRHFLTVGKGHYVAKHCDWWRTPQGMFSRMTRLAYSTPLRPPAKGSPWLGKGERGDGGPGGVAAGQLNASAEEYPNLYSVPYPSSVHWSAARPGDPTHHEHRSVLMQFMGGTDHGDVEVRGMIAKQCAGYKDERICEIVSFDSDARSLLLKARATFCLEPGGDSPWRKSLSDTVAFSCIPVLFSKLTDSVAPWFWGSWRKDARVLIDRTAFIAGGIDLREYLGGIPRSRVEKMQRQLAEKKKAFQYSLDDDPGDAVDVLLHGVASASREMWGP